MEGSQVRGGEGGVKRARTPDRGAVVAIPLDGLRPTLLFALRKGGSAARGLDPLSP